MKFRSPIYLNLNALADVADAYDLDTREVVEVRERNARSRALGGGLGAGPARIEGDRGSEAETEETYSRKRSAISLLDQVLERAHQDGDVVVDATTGVSRNSLVEFEGHLRSSSATEFVEVIRMMLPMMPSLVSAQTGPPEQAAMMQQVLNEIANEDNPSLWEVDHEMPELPRVLVKMSRQHLWRDQTMDDLDGEHTVLALVDQIVPESGEFSLERHLLPGTNRALRRVMSGSAMEGMLQSVMKLPGANPTGVAPSLRVPGPLYVVNTIAVY